MFAHGAHACDVGRKIGTSHFHLDGAKALGKIIVGLPGAAPRPKDRGRCRRHNRARGRRSRRADGTAEDRRGAPSNPTARCRAPRAQAPVCAAPAIMQTPPDVIPDTPRCRRLPRPSISSGISRRRTSANGAAIAADRIGIARAFGSFKIANAACHQFEGCDFAMCAVGEGHRRAGFDRSPVSTVLMTAIDFHPRFLFSRSVGRANNSSWLPW